MTMSGWAYRRCLCVVGCEWVGQMVAFVRGMGGAICIPLLCVWLTARCGVVAGKGLVLVWGWV
jgi:hypothetical protein